MAKQDLKNFDTSELTFDNIGIWPVPYKATALLIAALVVGFIAYSAFIKDMGETLERLQAKEVSLKQEHRKKAFDAANLEALTAQMEEMEKSFRALLDQLPKRSEVAGLLEDIDEVGRGSSIVMNAMDLEDEVSREFFVELPIKIQASGGYHDFGALVSGIAALPRIVTLHDFEIQGSRDNNLLNMTIQAKTYRYKSEDE